MMGETSNNGTEISYASDGRVKAIARKIDEHADKINGQIEGLAVNRTMIRHLVSMIKVEVGKL